ncbi:hypothetical protein ACMFMF_009787 [Clarireedia jacksonii]
MVVTYPAGAMQLIDRPTYFKLNGLESGNPDPMSKLSSPFKTGYQELTFQTLFSVGYRRAGSTIPKTAMCSMRGQKICLSFRYEFPV